MPKKVKDRIVEVYREDPTLSGEEALEKAGVKPNVATRAELVRAQNEVRNYTVPERKNHGTQRPFPK